jgi:lipopolysaccharide transport system ATP-binding protein
MSSSAVISVNNVSKFYQLYSSPSDRLKQFIFPKLRRFFGADPNHYYREFWALRDISFEVNKGEAVGILGRNGSGKSTLLQIITGTLFPSSGSVETNGRVAALLELGSGFNPEFSGCENVYLNGALLGLSREEIDSKFDAIASFADIGSHLDQPVKTYSSGMLVRLAFSVQVLLDPDILIVDEALAVGDAIFQKRCFQRLRQMIDRGVTLLFVSHDQESVRTLTNRAILLREGRMVAYGSSPSVVLEYRRQNHEDECAYLASFVEGLNTREVSGSNESAKAVQAHPALPISTQTTSPSPAELQQFGGRGISITKIEVLDQNEEKCSVFHPGDKIKIRVYCKSHINTQRINVSIRIRNKEGIKIFSWGTLNQDMRILANGGQEDLFWKKQIVPEEDFGITLQCECSLGANLYEVQACVSYEETPDYMNQSILHWIDEAAFFQVVIRRDENFFGGVVDLNMSAIW